MKPILALVDFSDVCGEVIEQSARLSSSLKRPLVLLHVAAPNPDFVGYEPGPQTVRDTVAGRLKKEHQDLHEWAARLRAKGINASPRLAQGPTIEKIREEITGINPELIIMGSHGHGLLRSLLVGSVAEGVLRRAPCPVLVVPARKP